MWMYIALCFIPLIAMFICIAVMAKGFKLWKGLLACILGLAAVIPIAIMQLFVGALISAKNLQGSLISAIVVNGLIEESIKMRKAMISWGVSSFQQRAFPITPLTIIISQI